MCFAIFYHQSGTTSLSTLEKESARTAWTKVPSSALSFNFSRLSATREEWLWFLFTAVAQKVEECLVHRMHLMNTYWINEWKLILLISGTTNNNHWTSLSKKGFSNIFLFKFFLNLAKGRLTHHITMPGIRRKRLWQRTKRDPTATLSGSNTWCGVEVGKDKGQQVIRSVSCAPLWRPKSEREEIGNT